MTAGWVGVAVLLVLARGMHRRWRKWPDRWSDKYSSLGRVKRIPTRPDRRMLEER